MSVLRLLNKQAQSKKEVAKVLGSAFVTIAASNVVAQLGCVSKVESMTVSK